jgi:hypothetical protein
MVGESVRKRLPPYVSYRTFQNFIDKLQQGLPSRIDRSYWDGILSGSTGIQLMAGLRFLGLVDYDGRPTERLKTLVSAKREDRADIYRTIAMESYSFAFHGSLDIRNGTYNQLDEVLHDTFQLTSDVSRKCIKFFMSLTEDAGIQVSPFMTKRLRKTRLNSGTKIITKKITKQSLWNSPPPSKLALIPEDNSWNAMLLAKFPNFDPSWNDEIKLKWFEAFDELMKRGFPGNGFPSVNH